MKEYVISKDDLRAVILPEKGATLVSLRCGEVEFLYQDPQNLASPERPRCGVPFLFPIFGRLKEETYLWDGKEYHMGIHGFAHTSPWQVVEHQEDSLHLMLESNPDTLAVYPFRFRVDMTFRLESDLIAMELRFENTGDTPMPYNYGFHPYFRVEDLSHARVEASAGVQIDFATGKALPFGHDTLTLTVPQGAPEVGAALAQLQSPTVLHIPEEGRQMTLAFSDDFPMLVLWTQAGKRFLCVEPINGAANGLNTGNYWTLNPGEVKQSVLRLRPQCI